jgi:hypothetical protein
MRVWRRSEFDHEMKVKITGSAFLRPTVVAFKPLKSARLTQHNGISH